MGACNCARMPVENPFWPWFSVRVYGDGGCCFCSCWCIFPEFSPWVYIPFLSPFVDSPPQSTLSFPFISKYVLWRCRFVSLFCVYSFPSVLFLSLFYIFKKKKCLSWFIHWYFIFPFQWFFSCFLSHEDLNVNAKRKIGVNTDSLSAILCTTNCSLSVQHTHTDTHIYMEDTVFVNTSSLVISLCHYGMPPDQY